MENVTIRVLINIAAGNKYEGNSEVEIVLEEMHLIGSPKFTNRMVTDKIAGLIDAAIIDYVRNMDGRVKSICEITVLP